MNGSWRPGDPRRRFRWAARITALVAFALAHPADPTFACTLFAATGARVVGGGVLVAKNRDWRPDHRQELRGVSDGNGYRYFGLYAGGGDAPGLKAGINERGLTIVTATAPLPRAARAAAPRTPGLVRRLLASSATVEEALRHEEWLRGASFLLLADRQQAAVVELAPAGRHAILRSRQGTLAHTNHYLSDALLDANPARLGSSSVARRARILQLLAQPASFDLAAFVRLSEDRVDGPDRAIWREGSTPHATRTLAAWIAYLPPSGELQLYVKLANPGEPPVTRRLTASDLFGAPGR